MLTLTMEDLLDETEEKLVYLGLVDIIYAYCYNLRATEGENNVSTVMVLSFCNGPKFA